MSPLPRYDGPAISLHWLVAVLIFGGFGLGWYMVDLPVSPDKLRYYAWHKWIGVTVFGLALLRGLWRLTHRPPPLPAGTPAWQRRAASATHALLYGLMLAIPVSGWLFSSASGFPTVYLGWVQLPDLVARDRELAAWLKSVHLYLNYTLAALVAVHVAASLKHQFVDRDGLLARMLPFLPARSPE
jgi:cytochrome b561